MLNFPYALTTLVKQICNIRLILELTIANQNYQSVTLQIQMQTQTYLIQLKIYKYESIEIRPGNKFDKVNK